MTLNEVIELIQEWIVTNGNEEITADVLRPILEAMVNQPNDLIGDLDNLTTTDKDNLVEAINEVRSLAITNAGLVIHSGSGTPIETPPVSVGVGDFYAQVIFPSTSVVSFWQYNGSVWVQQRPQRTRTVLKFVSLVGVTVTGKSQAQWMAEAINLNISNGAVYECEPGDVIDFFVNVSDITADRASVRRIYTRLCTGATSVTSVVANDLMPDGSEEIAVEGDLIIELGDIGSDDVWTAFNADPNQPFDMDNEMFVSAIQDGEPKLWQWIGGTGTFGSTATLATADDFLDLTEQPSVPSEVNKLFYEDIPAMLAHQEEQGLQHTLCVADASLDPDITFPSGETRLQAYYRYLGTTNGTMADYELISAPYGNHSPSELTPDELAGIQNANGLNAGNPVATMDDLLQNVTIVNILDFGAVGDGTTESAQFIQDALDFAETNGIRRVYAPSGTYLLETTIYIPTEIEFFGDGMDKTVFKIDAETVLDTIEMFAGATHYQNFYTPVISTKTTRTGATLNNILLKDFKIDDIYYDDTGLASQVCPMLILNTINSKIENVEFGNVQTEVEQDGTSILSLGLSTAFAENILIDKCVHGFAGYEVVSIRLLSKNITTRKNIFNIDKPSNLMPVRHALQVARPSALIVELENEYGETMCENYTSEGDIFNMIGGVWHAITTHSSKKIKIKNATINALNVGTDRFRAFKVFDNTSDAIITNNIINISEDNSTVSEAPYSLTAIEIGTTFLNLPDRENSKIVVSGNIINAELNRDVSALPERDISALIGNSTDVYLNASITDNVVNITGTGVRDQAVFGFYGTNIVANGNVVNFDGTVSQNMRAFVVEGGENINVVNNSTIGDHAYSLKVNDVETLENLIIGANNFPEEVLNLQKDKTKTISYNTEIASGTIINLDNPNGRTVDAPEYNSTYTFNADTIVRGGNETREITTLGETAFPTITGATLLDGSDFEADSIFEMVVYTLNGTDVYYFFLFIKNLSI